MGGSSPTPPAVQSASTTANTQQGYNLGAATSQQAMNLMDQSTPFGNVTYTQTGTGPNGVPIYSANTTLTPQMQDIYNSLQGGVQGQLNTGNYANSDPSQVIGNATSGTMGSQMSTALNYLDPFYSTETSQLDTQLRNQGIDPSSPAYVNQMRNLQANQNLGVDNLITSFEPTAYSQAVNNYTLPLQTATSEMGLLNPSEVSSSLVNPPQTTVQPTDYTTAQNNYQTALDTLYNQQVAANGNMMSGLFGIGSSLLGGMAKGGAFNGIGSTLGNAASLAVNGLGFS